MCRAAAERKILAFNPIGHALLKHRQGGVEGGGYEEEAHITQTHVDTHTTHKKKTKNGGGGGIRHGSPRLTCATQSRGRPTQTRLVRPTDLRIHGRLCGVVSGQTVLPPSPPPSSFRTPALTMRGY